MFCTRLMIEERGVSCIDVKRRPMRTSRQPPHMEEAGRPTQPKYGSLAHIPLRFCHAVHHNALNN